MLLNQNAHWIKCEKCRDLASKILTPPKFHTKASTRTSCPSFADALQTHPAKPVNPNPPDAPKQVRKVSPEELGRVFRSVSLEPALTINAVSHWN
jgi:hypothetical protein